MGLSFLHAGELTGVISHDSSPLFKVSCPTQPAPPSGEPILNRFSVALQSVIADPEQTLQCWPRSDRAQGCGLSGPFLQQECGEALWRAICRLAELKRIALVKIHVSNSNVFLKL